MDIDQMAYLIDPQLSRLKVRDLPVNRRQQLSSYLNSEQIIPSDSGLARDYRGVAHQLDISYTDIVQLDKHPDPFGTLLSYQNVSKLSVKELFELIAYIERFDLLDDMIPLLIEDLKTSPNDQCETVWYDAYVCYADTDIDFVRRLATYLESPQVGFRLFIRDRDLLGGNWAYETFAKLIETQCHRMIIVLSPEFLLCPDCKFQSQFATGLAIEQCSRKLIPIIYKQCNLPSMIRLLSKIDMSNGQTLPEWSLNRLVKSIRDTISPSVPMVTYSTEQRLIELVDSSPSPPPPPPSSSAEMPSTSDLPTTISTISDHNETKQLLNTDSARKSIEDNPKSWIKSFKRKIKISL